MSINKIKTLLFFTFLILAPIFFALDGKLEGIFLAIMAVINQPKETDK